jgi:hypothetical protein
VIERWKISATIRDDRIREVAALNVKIRRRVAFRARFGIESSALIKDNALRDVHIAERRRDRRFEKNGSLATLCGTAGDRSHLRNRVIARRETAGDVNTRNKEELAVITTPARDATAPRKQKARRAEIARAPVCRGPEIRGSARTKGAIIDRDIGKPFK